MASLTYCNYRVYLQLQITPNKLVTASEDHTVCVWYYKKKKYMSKVKLYIYKLLQTL